MLKLKISQKKNINKDTRSFPELDVFPSSKQPENVLKSAAFIWYDSLFLKEMIYFNNKK